MVPHKAGNGVKSFYRNTFAIQKNNIVMHGNKIHISKITLPFLITEALVFNRHVTKHSKLILRELLSILKLIYYCGWIISFLHFKYINYILFSIICMKICFNFCALHNDRMQIISLATGSPIKHTIIWLHLNSGTGCNVYVKCTSLYFLISHLHVSFQHNSNL